MSTTALIILNIHLLARLVAFKDDEATKSRKLWAVAGAQAVLFILLFDLTKPAWLILVLLTSTIGFLSFTEETPKLRIWARIFAIVVALLAINGSRLQLPLATWTQDSAIALADCFSLRNWIMSLNWPRVLTFSACLISSIDEAGMIVRSALQLLKVQPIERNQTALKPSTEHGSEVITSTPKINMASHRRGGLIGSLERILIIVFVSHNAYNAIAFILTAKSIVRFKEEMDSKESEYILIGTLISTIAGILLGLLTELTV